MIADDLLAKKVHAQNVDFFASLAPEVRSVLGVDETLLDLGGSVAFFAGEGSPLTQASGSLTAEHLRQIREFFHGRATSWEAIVTPFSEPGAMQRVIDLGAKVMGWESSLVRSTVDPLPDWDAPTQIRVDEVSSEDARVWSDVSLRAFFGEEPNEVASTLGRIFQHSNSIRRYLAYWNDEPAGAASLTPGRDISFLGGMGTLPAFRSRGIQMALLRHRLGDAREYGELATMGAEPGSASHRNSIRVGFQLAYTQLSLRVPTARE